MSRVPSPGQIVLYDLGNGIRRPLLIVSPQVAYGLLSGILFTSPGDPRTTGQGNTDIVRDYLRWVTASKHKNGPGGWYWLDDHEPMVTHHPLFKHRPLFRLSEHDLKIVLEVAREHVELLGQWESLLRIVVPEAEVSMIESRAAKARALIEKLKGGME